MMVVSHLNKYAQRHWKQQSKGDGKGSDKKEDAKKELAL